MGRVLKSPWENALLDVLPEEHHTIGTDVDIILQFL